MENSSLNVGGRGRTLPMWQLVVLIVLVAMFFGHSAWLNSVESNRAAYVQITDRIIIKSQQMAQYAKNASTGDVSAFTELSTVRLNVEQAVKTLRDGGAEVPALSNPDMQPKLSTINDRWLTINGNVQDILAQQEQVKKIKEITNTFAKQIPLLQSSSDRVVKRLVAINGNRQQIYLAGRQSILADRMLRRMSEILNGGSAAVQAAKALDSDTKQFLTVVTGMFDGDERVKAVDDDEAISLLGEVYKAFDSVQADIASVLGDTKDLFDAQTAADDVVADINHLMKDTGALQDMLVEQKRILPSVIFSYVIAALLFIWLILILRTLSRKDRVRAAVAQEQNERNQQAILRLLDEMASLADGDLTVNATVSEDITGAIADSVNYAIEALRSLVETINDASVGVASAAQEAQATAMHLAEASEHQAIQITNASAAINEIAVSIDEVSKNSLESADVAQRSVLIAHNGAKVVRDTIKGMNDIRTQIQDTSKRIKRLGESSQEIGNIVELINDIAEQTNILALNAAIQAASSGEAGRGFAVVADEVQQLAERASGSTRQIESIVKTIQTDTNEAVKSMEETTSEVVGGAKKAEDAGEALVEIETVSNDLAELIQNISEAARQQSVAATNISGTMNVIQEITTQTSAGTQQTAESIGNLVELASELRKSVEDFKLPDDDFV